ncbi:MAG: tRNA (N6-isopentenyl adenosine(37)-C2)-methylthiotransferase MiaB [Candidatus Omnitrophica bacterium]|nr:tRNA (N6-isopentenyl adenosine(37)-C2)-methylthiotransferase MiaB [Candidatus Omnitrophota bacterium]
MNDFDSEIIMGMLRERGYFPTEKEETADIILFNTCSVRQHAEDRVFGKVGDLKQLKRERPDLVIGIVGCMAQNYKEAIFDRLPHVDFISGPRNIYDIPELIERVQGEGTRLAAVDKEERPQVMGRPIAREGQIKAWVTVMEGCHHNCTFCIVPTVRGTAQSRPVEMILSEVKSLDAQGYKEVTLIGQIVDAYGRDLSPSTDLATLLGEVNRAADTIHRIRFTTSHPVYANEKLFDAIREHPRVCEHLHLPIQSGSDRILSHMRRGYTVENYKKRIEEFRKRFPKGAVTTDVIVGYPGETEEDFGKTFQLMGEVEFDDAFIFKFSPRPGTDAMNFKDDVSKKDKEARNQSLLRLQGRMTEKKLRSMMGETVEVLVEGKSKKDKSEYKGRTRTSREVVFRAKYAAPGDLLQVKVDSFFGKTLLGSAA